MEEKYKTSHNRSRLLFTHKIPGAMKLGVLSIALSLSAFSTNLNAQPVSVSVSNAKVKTVLESISSQTGLTLAYSEEIVDLNRKVSVNVKNTELDEVLNNIFVNTSTSYEIKDGKIYLFETPSVSQQVNTVKGTVLNPSGLPVIGANILIKGTTEGTITDLDGHFTIDVPRGKTLLFSYIGYTNYEVKIENQRTLNITLKEDSETLEEVVVVGYGTQKKATLTGAVSSVKSEQLTIAPTANVTNSLTGKLPGLITKQTSGMPGSDAANLSIRGFGNALVIVDGVEGSLSNLDANQIENISILKDGAASIYGARAGNGVILVTTKRGTIQKPTITFNASYTMQGVTNLADKASSGEWAQMLREEHLQSGQPEETAPFTEEAVQKYFDGTDPAYQSYNWHDAIFRKWAPQHNENVSVRGGSEKIKYYGLFGYQNQQTIIKKNGGEYSRYNLQSNIDAAITDRLKLSIDLSAVFDNGKFSGRGLSGGGTIWQDYYTTRPWYPITLPDPTKHSYGGIDVGSAALTSNMDIWGYNLTKNKDLKASASLEYEVPHVQGLKVKGTVSYWDTNTYNKNFQKPYKFYTYNQAADLYTLAGEMWGKAQLNESVEFHRQFTQQYSLNYNRVFKEVHSVKALALFECIDESGNNLWAFRKDFMTPAIDQMFAGSNSGKDNGGSASEMGRMSVVGRLNYSYADKYLADFILRADASAKFAKDNRWGYFPSVSVGWVISKENFMANCNKVDQLKLRMSYGSSGYDYIGNFQYLAGYNISGIYQWGDKFVNGLYPTSLANPFITWEKMKTYNVGVDFSLFGRQLYGSVEGFYRDRSGILATRTNSLPGTFGASTPYENINSSNDRGFELSLGTTNSIGEFNYDISANVSWTRAKWDHFEEIDYTDPDQIRMKQKSGQWTDRVFGYVSDGLFTSQQEIDALPYQYEELGGNNATLRPGDVKYKDINNDGVLNWKDQTEIGNGDTPHWFYGLSGLFSYKNFDLDAVFQGAAGYSVMVRGNEMNKRTYDNRWTAETNDADALQPRLGGASSNNWSSDYWLKAVSYLRLKNIAFGYTLPQEWVSKLNIEKLRFYISATNLFTLSSVSEYNIDPEIASGSSDSYYPQQKTISFGVNLSF